MNCSARFPATNTVWCSLFCLANIEKDLRFAASHLLLNSVMHILFYFLFIVPNMGTGTENELWTSYERVSSRGPQIPGSSK